MSTIRTLTAEKREELEAALATAQELTKAGGNLEIRAVFRPERGSPGTIVYRGCLDKNSVVPWRCHSGR
jgi:hypothetical protein